MYDTEKIISQYNRLKKAFHKIENFKIHYAVKALSNVSVLKLLKNEGCGLDTVSIEEVMLGLHAGFQPNEIMYTPNGVSFEEIIVGGKIIDIIENPVRRGQHMIVFEHKKYIWIAPCIIEDENVFLKTLLP